MGSLRCLGLVGLIALSIGQISANILEVRQDDICLITAYVFPTVVEYPVLIQQYFEENTILIVNGGVTININNAPTSLSTTVTATSTSTTTSTVTATATATSALFPAIADDVDFQISIQINGATLRRRVINYLLPGGFVSSDPTDSLSFVIKQNQLFAGVGQFSVQSSTRVNAILPIIFTPSATLGNIRTSFAATSGGSITWSNPAFTGPNSRAQFCVQSTNSNFEGTLFVYFNGAKPNLCTDAELIPVFLSVTPTTTSSLSQSPSTSASQSSDSNSASSTFTSSTLSQSTSLQSTSAQSTSQSSSQTTDITSNSSQLTSSTSIGSTTTSSSTTSSTSAASTNLQCLDCVDIGYGPFGPDITSPLGVQNLQVDTITDCADECAADNTCQSIQFTSDPTGDVNCVLYDFTLDPDTSANTPTAPFAFAYNISTLSYYNFDCAANSVFNECDASTQTLVGNNDYQFESCFSLLARGPLTTNGNQLGTRTDSYYEDCLAYCISSSFAGCVSFSLNTDTNTCTIYSVYTQTQTVDNNSNIYFYRTLC